MESIEITIKGRVQGVGFRYYIKKVAQKLAVKGYVKNMPNGDVFIVAKARKDVLENFLSYCRAGPRMSNVQSIDYQKIPDVGFSGFSIHM